MTEEQNSLFVNDKRRVDAQNKLDMIVRHIQNDISAQGNAQYYMTVLPQLLKSLSDAYENLATVEAMVEAEVASKSRFHG